MSILCKGCRQLPSDHFFNRAPRRRLAISSINYISTSITSYFLGLIPKTMKPKFSFILKCLLYLLVCTIPIPRLRCHAFSLGYFAATISYGPVELAIPFSRLRPPFLGPVYPRDSYVGPLPLRVPLKDVSLSPFHNVA